MVEDFQPGAAPRGRRRRSTPTGATRASSPSATWASASAPARSCQLAAVRLRASRERGVRGAAAARQPGSSEGRREGLRGDAHGGQDAGAAAVARRAGRSRTRSSTSSARGSSTRRSSGTRITTASSPTTCSPGTKGRTRATHADTAHKLVEEANLFIDAAHKCDSKVQAMLAQQQQAAVGVVTK